VSREMPACSDVCRLKKVLLRRHGIDVIEIDSSELVRGRGGPRCMSMSLDRETPSYNMGVKKWNENYLWNLSG